MKNFSTEQRMWHVVKFALQDNPITAYVDDEDVPVVTINRIAWMQGCSKSTARRVVRHMQGKGLLTELYTGGRGVPTVYAFTKQARDYAAFRRFGGVMQMMCDVFYEKRISKMVKEMS